MTTEVSGETKDSAILGRAAFVFNFDNESCNRSLDTCRSIAMKHAALSDLSLNEWLGFLHGKALELAPCSLSIDFCPHRRHSMW